MRIVVLIFSIFLISSCKKNNSDTKYLRNLEHLEELKKHRLSKEDSEFIRNNSILLIDSILGKTRILKEWRRGPYYLDNKIKYLDSYIYDTKNNYRYKIIKVNYDLNLNLLNWDTITHVPAHYDSDMDSIAPAIGSVEEE